MKRLLLLFPLYILFLSGLPCSPNDGCCAEEIQAAASAGDHNCTNNQNNTNNHNNTNDHNCPSGHNSTNGHNCTSGHHNANDPKSNLPCSPFFPCGACHGIVIPNHTIRVAQPRARAAKQPFFYPEKPLLAYTPSIWQPPKSA